MSDVNPYQPAAESGGTPARASTASPKLRQSRQLNRVLSTLISAISVVLLAFSLSEIAITVVVTTPLEQIADFTKEFDGLIVFFLPIFVIPSALFVGIVLGVIGQTRMRLVICVGLSVFLSIAVSVYIFVHDMRPKPAFTIALVISGALILASWGTDTILRRIAITREANTGTGSVSSIVAAVLSSFTIVTALALAFTSEFKLPFFLLAFLYIGGLTAAAIGSMYNLAAYRGQHWSSWLCLISVMLSPVILVLV